MRLWHYDLIDVLPRRQLLSQWREVKYIKTKTIELGKTNHNLVNIVIDYPVEDLKKYGQAVVIEMIRRGYKVNLLNYYNLMEWNGDGKFITDTHPELYKLEKPNITTPFPEWHNNKYLRQCLANLKEKYDRGAIPDSEWQRVDKKFTKIIKQMKI